MRKLTMDEIQTNKSAKDQLVNYAVHLFREKTMDEGWVMKRVRPRDLDEIRALDQVSRKSFLTAMEKGTVKYDKESRVLLLAKYSGS